MARVHPADLAAARSLILQRLAEAARSSDEPWLDDDDEASWHARVFWKNVWKVTRNDF